jgi:hypothetical protein
MLTITALVGGLLGGFCKMMLKNSPTILDFIQSYLLNKQKIKLSKLNPQPKVESIHNCNCNVVCRYVEPSKGFSKQKEAKIFQKLKISVISIVFVLSIIYLIADFFLIAKYYLDFNDVVEILDGYREIAIGMLMFIITWALTDKATTGVDFRSKNLQNKESKI